MAISGTRYQYLHILHIGIQTNEQTVASSAAAAEEEEDRGRHGRTVRPAFSHDGSYVGGNNAQGHQRPTILDSIFVGKKQSAGGGEKLLGKIWGGGREGGD
ncbi:hypothetical protein FRC18_003640 [Serendipita sp. 400]|nr:hypothetical protein FRC18_003640 [Serendipita sp. 400]